MGKDTGIQWCDDTVNSTTGCDGCELHIPSKGGPCYAGVLHETRLAKTIPELYDPVFTNVRLAPGRMIKAAGWSDLRGTDRPSKPWLNGMPRMIFVGDMGDILSKDVPFDYLQEELIGIANSPKGSRHIWMMLTKQADRLAEFSDWLFYKSIVWPRNLWAGVSVTSAKNLSRINKLRWCRASTKFVSFEPILSDLGSVDLDGIQLAIIGGESRQRPHEPRPFDVEWARRLVRDCDRYGVAPFVKQMGSAAFDSSRRISITGPESHAIELDLKDSHGGDWGEWPEDLRIRRMPRIVT